MRNNNPIRSAKPIFFILKWDLILPDLSVIQECVVFRALQVSDHVFCFAHRVITTAQEHEPIRLCIRPQLSKCLQHCDRATDMSPPSFYMRCYKLNVSRE